ncbi:polysaccharide lyase [Modicisalibacter radicis]|uniref:polysaccharide lyase n=1 Tax=Halomonas sp. EAR18 TaxID=2518972 RepID=UPI001FCE3C3F|nr:hypothetical protein [Halomonas sp. EAR18]
MLRNQTLPAHVPDTQHRGRMLGPLLFSLALSGALALPASADDESDTDASLSVPAVSACSERYPLVASPEPHGGGHGDMEQVIEASYSAKKHWGLDKNVSLLSTQESGLGEPAFRVTYPEGTSAPSDTEEGGAGFYAKFDRLHGAERACLKYQVRFEEGFEFVKGGKLPGLYGGNAPSGGDEVSGKDGFSMRFMWRKEGQGELYEYVANKDSDYGDSVGRGKWTFPTGEWITLEQEIILNDPERDNGIARVWIDGEPILEQHGIVYRTTDDLSVDGVMFSTFFGGHGEDWRTPRDQVADFGAFEVFAPEP